MPIVPTRRIRRDAGKDQRTILRIHRLLRPLRLRPCRLASSLPAGGAASANRLKRPPLRLPASAGAPRPCCALSPPSAGGGSRASSPSALAPCQRLVRCLRVRAAGGSLARGGPLRPSLIPGGSGREVASPSTVPGPLWLPRGPMGGGLKLPSLDLAPLGRRRPSPAPSCPTCRVPIGTSDEAGVIALGVHPPGLHGGPAF